MVCLLAPTQMRRHATRFPGGAQLGAQEAEQLKAQLSPLLHVVLLQQLAHHTACLLAAPRSRNRFS